MERLTAGISPVDWLLASDEPGSSRRALLAGQQPDGGFAANVYAKWQGAHWRLVSFVELGVPAGEPRRLAAAETVLAWLTGRAHRSRVQVIDG